MRDGVTVRRRVERGKGVWQVKLPRESARLELEMPGGPSGPPDTVRELLFAYLRGHDLLPIARLQTRRTGIRVQEDESPPLADVVIDSVAVLDGRRVINRFLELEVELGNGDEKALRRITTAIRAAGAQDSDGRPKVFQALNVDYLQQTTAISPSAPAVDHLKAKLQAQVAAILAHDPGTRLGKDPEELHQFRVATRRLRALLRAARSMLVPEWGDAIRAEISWLGKVLGVVRDYDVLLEHLQKEATRLYPPERRVFERLLSLLHAEREDARVLLLDALKSDRYLKLIDRLEVAAYSPEVVSPHISLRDIAVKAFNKLRRNVRKLHANPSQEALHQLRIKGKQARYAAELAEVAVGKSASRFIRQAKRFQDLLGAHQDAVMTEERLRQLMRGARGVRAAFAVGRIIERLRIRRQTARAAFPEVWAKLQKRGRQAWLDLPTQQSA